MLYRKQANLLYTLSLVVAWVTTMTDFSITWLKYRWAYVLSNTSPDVYYLNHSFLSATLTQIPGWVPYMIADGILVKLCAQSL